MMKYVLSGVTLLWGLTACVPVSSDGSGSAGERSEEVTEEEDMKRGHVYSPNFKRARAEADQSRVAGSTTASDNDGNAFISDDDHNSETTQGTNPPKTAQINRREQKTNDKRNA